MSQERNTRMYMFLRLVMLFTVLFSLVLYQSFGFGSIVATGALSRLYLITFFTFLVTTAFVFLAEKTRHINYFLSSQIAYDILFTSALIFYTGPSDTVFTVFYLFNIIFAAIAYSTRGALLAGVASAAMYLVVSALADSSGERMFSALTTTTGFVAVPLLAGQLVEELKKSRQHINRLEQLSEEIVDSLDSGLLALDEKGCVQKLNRTAAEILGAGSDDAALGKPLVELFPALGDGARNEVKEAVIKGRKRRILVTRVGLPERHSMVLIRDLTDVLELEERLRRHEKLAGFDRLAAGVAHEIRNPIASISGAAQLLSGSDSDAEERQRLTSVIVRESERVDRLVAQLLKFTKPTKSTREEVDLGEILQECVESLKARQDFQSLNGDVRLVIDGKLKLKGNRDQLSEAVTNLLTNATQAFLEMKKKVACQISVEARISAGEIELVVSDNGPGIPHDFVARVFDPFFTTKGSGTGLGLAQVHKIIRDHDGNIEIDTEEGRGTAMRIRLPA